MFCIYLSNECKQVLRVAGLDTYCARVLCAVRDERQRVWELAPTVALRSAAHATRAALPLPLRAVYLDYLFYNSTFTLPLFYTIRGVCQDLSSAGAMIEGGRGRFLKFFT